MAWLKRYKKLVIIIVAVLIVILSNIIYKSVKQFYINQLSATSSTFQGDNFKVTYNINNSCQNNENISIAVTNTSTESIENWAFKYDASGEISGICGGAVNKKDGSTYIIENA